MCIFEIRTEITYWLKGNNIQFYISGKTLCLQRKVANEPIVILPQNYYSCGLSTVTIEYHTHVCVCVCVCVCVSVCLSVYTATQK